MAGISRRELLGSAAALSASALVTRSAWDRTASMLTGYPQAASAEALAAVAPRRYRPGLARSSLAIILRFGIPLAGANFVNYTLLNVDYAFVGHLLGAAALGGRIFAPGGAMEAVLEAKHAGKIRYIGFTGHKSPAIHLEMLRTAFAHGFMFDAVQMPLNVMDAHYKSFAEKVVPVLVRHGIGVLGMKPLANGIILKSHTATPIECLHYAMNLPTSVVINGCESLERLHQGLRAARTFRPLSEKEVAAILAKTAVAAAQGRFEPFKTSHDFDGTYHHPQWLG